jgi:transposase
MDYFMARSSAALAVTPEDKAELERLVRSGKTEQRVAFRGRIVLAAASGLANKKIAEALSTSRPTVIDWRKRYEAEGIAGLFHDRPRGKAFAALPQDQEAAVVEKTLQDKPAHATHWSCRSMADAAGISKASVQRIWNAHGLKPHLVKTFKLSNGPHFVEKLHDVVGLYMSPPEHALVFCIDEKSQIQALDRTQPGLPMKQGRAGTMTHDYKRNGTTTLFAALDVLKGEVIGQCMKRHRHQEFLKFLQTIDQNTPPHLDIPRHRRQLRHPQETSGQRLAGQASALASALHPHRLIVAQSGRALVRPHHPSTHPQRRLQERLRTGTSYLPIHRP